MVYDTYNYSSWGLDFSSLQSWCYPKPALEGGATGTCVSSSANYTVRGPDAA